MNDWPQYLNIPRTIATPNMITKIRNGISNFLISNKNSKKYIVRITLHLLCCYLLFIFQEAFVSNVIKQTLVLNFASCLWIYLAVRTYFVISAKHICSKYRINHTQVSYVYVSQSSVFWPVGLTTYNTYVCIWNEISL